MTKFMLKLTVFCVICFKFGLTGLVSGLFCKDPDTGEFHPLNTTWPSTSFCGSYTCKLKRKNETETRFNPLEEVVVDNDTKSKPPMAKQSGSPTDRIEQFNNNFKTILSLKDGDRYLSDDEIKSITNLLHTVKKSDIDSLIEIYSLAQDIYKELENSDDFNNSHDSINEINKVSFVSKNYKKGSEPHKTIPLTSYWYEPLNTYNTKANVGSSNDMEKSSSDHVPTKILPKDTQQVLSNPKDINKLAYYYPMSSFHRLSSYVYDPYVQARMYPQLQMPQTTTNNNIPKFSRPPCHSGTINPYSVITLSPWVNKIVKKPFIVEPPEKRRSSVMLPYPFSSIHHYNISSYPNDLYFDGRYWTNFYGKYTTLSPLAYVYPGLVPQTKIISDNDQPSMSELDDNKAIENEMSLVENSVELLNTIPNTNDLVDESKADELAPWQTKPLSSQVLDEVRANVLARSLNLFKTSPLKKQVKLERVGKLIRLDDISRSKRDVSDNVTGHQKLNNNDSPENEFEAILVKNTCDTSIELGYFRRGNQSLPYPGCCPVKIVK